jgi:hypothetical protein
MEPDHYQRLTCEHIAISELTDRHMDAQELTNVTAQAALTGILTGTGWAVGNVTATGTSSADLALGSVWQNVRTIEANWNVYITPRVTFNTSGITGRYLDIAPAQGTWRGIRLSLDKNADEMGVVIDDTEVKTALFGYGASTDGVPLTFATAVWQQTAEHPAKPAGQTYLEDPDATAAYGRNGAARFGFYQNADITDAQTLLEKTWEALKATNAPRVTINCMVRDLYRMGYADQPIRLHDTAMVQIRQTNTNLQLEIIQLTVDLLDPTATRPTIGAYIPNIVYIQRDTGREARGGASNTLSGRRGGGGKSARENQLSEFETEIRQNQYQISLRAYQRDVTNMENILKEAGVAIDASGVIIYAGNNLTQMKSAIQVNDDRISLVVTDGANPQIKPASIVTAINNSGSTVSISADKILLDGDTLATKFTALSGSFNDLVSGNLSASKLVATAINVSNLEITNSLVYGGYGDLKGKIISGIGTAAESGGQITIPTTYLDGTAGPSINFNIAATAKYQTDVAAAERTGWTNAIGTVRINNSSSGAGDKTVNLASGGSVTVYAQGKDNSGAAVYTTYGTVTVNAEAVVIDSVNGTQGTTWGTWYIPVTMTATASNGETGSNTINVDARDVYTAGYNAAPVNPTVSQCYVRSFSVSSVSKSGDGYEVVGSVTIRINFSDGTHQDYTYTVRDIA